LKKQYPQVTYGAVYFRKSNPPQEEWERDYAQAAADGMNMFRHWFLWGSIETAPGVYDWEDYDRQLDLAAKNGIGTVIAEFSANTPEWFFRAHPELFAEMRDGTRAPYSGVTVSAATGGSVPGGLCLDHEESRTYVKGFLQALASRYKGHPGLFGYDVQNESNYHKDVCYCPATQAKFRLWLQKRYGSLEALNKAWHRYSYASWEDVLAPRYEAQSPECMDWLLFRKENFYEMIRWKIGVIRGIDPDARITAHGVAASLDYTYGDGNDDWMAASNVESYGMTWVMSRKGTEPWKQWQALDLVRAASRGKTFWHAEMQGGPLWLQPQVIGREKEDGRVTTAEDVRLWNLVSLAGGARGIQYLRWRSLLDGPLFGAFGLYSNNGLPNARSQMASRVAKWANAPENAELFRAKPVQGDLGIVVLDQIQEFNRILQQAGKGKFYALCQWGAYQGFFDVHVQPDWVHFDDIDQYKTLYFAYPIQLNADQAAKLITWVEKGGCLLSEGLIGYFGDRGHVGMVQPNLGLDRVFGAAEEEVEFMPDLGDRIRFDFEDVKDIPGGLFLQSYVSQGAEVLGRYADGRVAAVSHSYGKGKAILLGTFPSEGYYRTHDESVRALYARLLEKAGVTPRITVGGGDLKVRLQEDGDRKYLWVLNHANTESTALIRVKDMTRVGKVLWGAGSVGAGEGGFAFTVPGKDAMVAEVF